jgi:hypothetical protein
MSDFNAQKGKERNGCESTKRTHEEGERNIDGDSLLDMCNRNGWVIGNS